VAVPDGLENIFSSPCDLFVKKASIPEGSHERGWDEGGFKGLPRGLKVTPYQGCVGWWGGSGGWCVNTIHQQPETIGKA